MSISIIATLTDYGRQKIAEMMENGNAFKVTQFSVGSGGHDPGDPSSVLTPNPANTSLPDQTFGPKLIAGYTFTSPFCPKFQCLLDYDEGNGNVSSYGLWATVTSGPHLNEIFLLAYGNSPLKVKTDDDQFDINLTIQT